MKMRFSAIRVTLELECDLSACRMTVTVTRGAIKNDGVSGFSNTQHSSSYHHTMTKGPHRVVFQPDNKSTDAYFVYITNVETVSRPL
jgi:hypothetical protein